MVTLLIGGQSARFYYSDPTRVEQFITKAYNDYEKEPDSKSKAYALGMAILHVVKSAFTQSTQDVQRLAQYTGITQPELTTVEKFKLYVSDRLSDVLKNLSPEAKWAYGLTLSALMVGSMGLAAAWPSIRRRLLKTNNLKDVKTPLDTQAGRKQPPGVFMTELVPYSLSLRSESESKSKIKSKSKPKSKSAHK
jgi:hypothetical protein